MLEKLKEMMANVVPDVDMSSVTLETRLVEDLHFDSLATMMLAMAIEDEYNMQFDEPMNFGTVGDVIKFLDTLKK